MRTRPSAALALAKLARDKIHLWCVESEATSPQFAEDIRLVHCTDEGAQAEGLYLEHYRRTFSLFGACS